MSKDVDRIYEFVNTDAIRRELNAVNIPDAEKDEAALGITLSRAQLVVNVAHEELQNRKIGLFELRNALLGQIATVDIELTLVNNALYGDAVTVPEFLTPKEQRLRALFEEKMSKADFLKLMEDEQSFTLWLPKISDTESDWAFVFRGWVECHELHLANIYGLDKRNAFSRAARNLDLLFPRAHSIENLKNSGQISQVLEAEDRANGFVIEKPAEFMEYTLYRGWGPKTYTALLAIAELQEQEYTQKLDDTVE